jgi:hypothetical protein
LNASALDKFEPYFPANHGGSPAQSGKRHAIVVGIEQPVELRAAVTPESAVPLAYIRFGYRRSRQSSPHYFQEGHRNIRLSPICPRAF